METTTNLRDLLIQHLTWYPLMELRDIYKLIYQGVMGPGHLISSPDDFYQSLVAESDRLIPDPLERIIEPVRPDMTLYRLYLRAFKAHKGRLDRLLPCLLETAGQFTEDFHALWETWKAFNKLCQDGSITVFSPQEVTRFTNWLEGLDFPAVHHSEEYRRAYRPAYRLISSRFLHQLGLDIGY